MKKFKKLLAMGLAVMASVSAMSISAFADYETINVTNMDISETENVIEVNGEPGDVIDIGGGFKFVITEGYNSGGIDVQSARASGRLWNITDLAPSNIYTTGGFYVQLAFVLNSTYPYVHIDLTNTQPSGERTRLRIYGNENATNPITSYITVTGGQSGYVFHDEPLSGTYFMRFSSDTEVKGASYAYRASSLPEVM